jgi:hypothetical protein
MGKVFATMGAGYAGERVGDIGRERDNTGDVWGKLLEELLAVRFPRRALLGSPPSRTFKK